ncbi:hypothetical protein J2R76_004076 [Bradyrhizobium sp. USDA 4532]|nr:hypothetical protein [Bradyrhizobium sp. USDA 4545]MCP1920485.1 hypothetical protein [Bradyrhizobium sp. USDA 4532]
MRARATPAIQVTAQDHVHLANAAKASWPMLSSGRK